MISSDIYKITGMAIGLIAVGAGSYFCIRHQLYFCLTFLGIAAIYCIVALYRQRQQSIKKMMRMLEGISNKDLSINYILPGFNPSEQKLGMSINRIITELRERQAQREADSQYYETLLNTVDTLLLVLNDEGEIHWMNKSAIRELLGFRIHHISELNVLHPEFSDFIQALSPGSIKSIRILRKHTTLELAVTVTYYQTPDNKLRVYSLRNVHTLLESKEMESWQKLVRVLTHEIMNSITPIISLSDTLCDRALPLEESDPIMLQGIRTIHRRSKGLMLFIENYRKLTRLPSPTLAPVALNELLSDLQKLYPQCVFQNKSKELNLDIDRSQIEQVLINLLKNATEATSHRPDPKVTLHVSSTPRMLRIKISDNGKGILPRFSTRYLYRFSPPSPTAQE